MVTTRSGAAASGVTSESTFGSWPAGSGPFAPSSSISAEAFRTSRPAAAGSSSVTANVTEPVPPPARSGTSRVQAPPGWSVQSGLASGSIETPGGGVNASVTPVAPCGPAFS